MHTDTTTKPFKHTHTQANKQTDADDKRRIRQPASSDRLLLRVNDNDRTSTSITDPNADTAMRTRRLLRTRHTLMSTPNPPCSPNPTPNPAPATPPPHHPPPACMTPRRPEVMQQHSSYRACLPKQR